MIRHPLQRFSTKIINLFYRASLYKKYPDIFDKIVRIQERGQTPILLFTFCSQKAFFHPIDIFQKIL